MRKKVQQRLIPFLSMSESELKNSIKSLSPAELGELKDLMGQYVQEAERVVENKLAGIKTPAIREIVISPLNKVKKTNSIILEAFNLRQQIKLEKRLT